MIYFYAQVEDLRVTRIRVVSAAQVETEDGLDHSRATSLLAELHGVPEAQWVPCPFDESGTSTYVTLGFTYDTERQAFIPPKPLPSWVLDEGTLTWSAPVPMPEDGDYVWNEGTQSWDPVSEA